MMEESTIQWNDILEDAVELHAHSAPSIFPRKQDDWELVRDVEAARMSGIVIKAHEGVSYDRATLLKKKYPHLNIFGGLVCNSFVGGLNTDAVELALNLGAKVIWMPTLSSEQHKKYFLKNKKENILSAKEETNFKNDTISIYDGPLIKNGVKQILSLIAQNDAVLATGHLKSTEVIDLVKEAKIQGVKHILIQHADLGISPFTIEEQLHLVKEGCLIEKCYLACSDDFKDISINHMAESIYQLGVENCVLVTDYGQKHNIPVVEALETFALKLVRSGVKKEDVRKMIVDNPKRLLSI
jgi:hypothetical protein